MKAFMLRHKHDWLPQKLYYGRTYWVAMAGVSHEGFTFKLSKNSKFVITKDDSGEYVESKQSIRGWFQEGYLQFAVEIEPEED